jgi:hypothetical protein
MVLMVGSDYVLYTYPDPNGMSTPIFTKINVANMTGGKFASSNGSMYLFTGSRQSNRYVPELGGIMGLGIVGTIKTLTLLPLPYFRDAIHWKLPTIPDFYFNYFDYSPSARGFFLGGSRVSTADTTNEKNLYFIPT